MSWAVKSAHWRRVSTMAARTAAAKLAPVALATPHLMALRSVIGPQPRAVVGWLAAPVTGLIVPLSWLSVLWVIRCRHHHHPVAVSGMTKHPVVRPAGLAGTG